MTGVRRFAFVVTADEAGERIDRFCASRLADEAISRSTVGRLCELGEVRLGGRAVRASLRVRPGDAIEIQVPPPEAPSALPEDIPLVVLFEDDAVLVVDKPAGLVVHPARGHASGTLVNAVLHHAGALDDDSDDVDPLRPGIVHRLDKDTSGVLVVAKSAASREALKSQFQAHSIERSYLGITVGVPPSELTCDTLHGRHPTDRLRFSSRVREGRRAVTHVELLEPLARNRAALVRCRLETGRTHQIRMHLSEAGYPLLGDPLYGRRPDDARVRTISERLGRQALHAEVLGFRHPISGELVRCVAPPPEDFRDALESLRSL